MSSAMTTYVSLLTAIVLEVAGTSFLQKSQQFTKLWPTLVMGLCYAGAFYCLSITLKAMPVGIAYAIWAGLGIVLITAVGYFFFGQSLDAPALLGIGLIVAGVVIVNAFSSAIPH
nr:SMR family transporter [Pseudodesulfovibrio sp. SB368]